MVHFSNLFDQAVVSCFTCFQGETLETVTQATLCLFTAQPQLADQVCVEKLERRIKSGFKHFRL